MTEALAWTLLLATLTLAWYRSQDPSQHYLPMVLSAIAFGAIRLLWLSPKRQVARSAGLTAANRFDRENKARKTLAQIIGGALVLVGLYSSVKTFDLQRQTENVQEQTERSQEQGQINERFTKAIDQLGAVIPGGVIGKDKKRKINLEVRLGGIYALEQIAKNTPEKYHWTVMEVLTAYVRENARAPDQVIRVRTGDRQHNKGDLVQVRQRIFRQFSTL